MRPLDLTGRRFGRLVVLRENPVPYRSPGGKPTRRWDCRCDCGREITVLQNALTGKRNPAPSCGCSRRLEQQIARGSREDLTGRRFGRLTVRNPAPLERPETNGNLTGWRCQCDCGKEIIVPRRYLISGGTQSCGCLIGERAGERVHDAVGHFAGTTLSAILPERNANRNSRSGVKGVYYNRREKRWIAKIMFRRQSVTIGRFRTLAEAEEARLAVEKEVFGPVIKEYRETPKWTLKAPDGTVYQANSLRQFCERDHPELFENPRSAVAYLAALSNRKTPGSYKGWTLVYRKRKDFPARGNADAQDDPAAIDTDFDIREARRKAGLTQKELAAIVGVAPATVGLWEHGIHKPHRKTLARIMAALK